MIANWKGRARCVSQAKHLTLSVCAIHIFLSVWTLICFVGGGPIFISKKAMKPAVNNMMTLKLYACREFLKISSFFLAEHGQWWNQWWNRTQVLGQPKMNSNVTSSLHEELEFFATNIKRLGDLVKKKNENFLNKKYWESRLNNPD